MVGYEAGMLRETFVHILYNFYITPVVSENRTWKRSKTVKGVKVKESVH